MLTQSARGGRKTAPLDLMKRRTPKILKESSTVVVIEEVEPPQTLSRRMLGCLLGALGWLLVCVPGLFMIFYGVVGIYTKRLTGGRMRTMSYGDDAVGWGWILVGVGFWALGMGFHLKTGRGIAKLLGWILAGGAVALGVWILLRKFVSHPA